MNRLQGKVAIITGAASGMGFAAAQLFADEGAQVIALDVKNINNIEQLNNPSIKGYVFDVSSGEKWEEIAAETFREYGRIDILVNNAGLSIGPHGIFETDEKEWDLIMNVDLKGMWLGIRAVAPYMKEKGGSIINTSSIGGIMGGFADGGSVAYAAAKGGVRTLTKHCANELGMYNIRVNSVHPGTTMTGGSGGNFTQEQIDAYLKALDAETPLAMKMAQPLDVAYLYLYLASDESRFATGAEFVLDGGLISH